MMTEEEKNKHLLWEIWKGNVFIGTCTTEHRITLMEKAIEAGIVTREDGIMNGTEQKLIGLINILDGKVRSSFRPTGE